MASCACFHAFLSQERFPPMQTAQMARTGFFWKDRRTFQKEFLFFSRIYAIIKYGHHMMNAV